MSKKLPDINITIESSVKMDNAFSELIKSFDNLVSKYQLNFFEAYGLLACLRVEVDKSLRIEDEKE